MSSKANREEDEDCLFLERVLDSLYDFGSGPKKMLKTQKKKKRKLEEEEEERPPVKTICSSSSSEEDYGGHVGSEHKQQRKTEPAGPAPPQVNQVEVVTFQDPRKKPKQKTAPNKTPAPQTTELKQNKQEELSLEQARLEVHRFGITGYKKEQQRVFEQDRAVMLGARPPKKDFVNYKELQQQIKEKKQKDKEEFQPDKKKKKKKSNQRDKKKSSSGPGPASAPSGQVGRFKNGMLVLNPKQIQKIKGNK